jgi:hypothetical protein
MSKLLETGCTGHNGFRPLNPEKYIIFKVKQWLLRKRLLDASLKPWLSKADDGL